MPRIDPLREGQRLSDTLGTPRTLQDAYELALREIESGDLPFALARAISARKTIILQHGSTYTTLYAHLHRYAKGTKTGKRP